MSKVRLISVLFLLVVVAVALTLAGAAFAKAGDTVTVTLNPQNNSGISGTATLTDLGNNQTKVVLALTGSPAGESEPVHIHEGKCPTPGGVKFPLTNVVNGASETTVNASLESLQTGNFAINGHKPDLSLGQAGYIFCGDIPAAAAAQTTATTAATAAATTAATSAATTAPTAAATAAPTAAPTATGGPGTLPTTGNDASGSWLLAAIVLGMFLLGAGLVVQRARQ